MRQPTSAYLARFSPDGETLAVCGNGTYDPATSICLWNTRTGKLQIEIPVPVTALAFSPDGQLMAGGDSQGRIHVWRASTGQSQQIMRVEFPLPGDLWSPRVYDLSFLRDGTLLSAPRGSRAGIIRRWDLASGAELPRHLKRHDGFVDSHVLAVSRDGKLMASAVQRSIRVWNMETNQRPVTIENPKRRDFTAIAFAKNGRFLVSSERARPLLRSDGGAKIRIWDPSTGQQLGTLGDEEVLGDPGIAVDEDRNRLVVATHKAIQVWDLTERRLLTRIPHDHRRGEIALHPEGQLLAMIKRDSKIEVFNLDSGKPLFDDAPSHDDAIVVVAYSPDERRVVTGGKDKQIHLWDAASGQHLRQLPFFPERAYDVQAVRFSPDSRILAVLGNHSEPATEDGVRRQDSVYIVGGLKLFDAETGDQKNDFRLPRAGTSQAFSADSKFLAVHSVQLGFPPRSRDPGSIYLFDVTAGQQVKRLAPAQKTLTTLAFSPQADRLWCVTADAKVREWDTTSGEVIQEFVLQAEGSEFAAISISSERLATSPGWRGAQIWNLRTGRLLRDIECPQPASGVSVLALSPDGARLAIGTESRTMSIHEVSNGSVLLEVPRLRARPQSLAFSADGTRLISGMEDSTAIIWELPPSSP